MIIITSLSSFVVCLCIHQDEAKWIAKRVREVTMSNYAAAAAGAYQQQQGGGGRATGQQEEAGDMIYPYGVSTHQQHHHDDDEEEGKGGEGMYDSAATVATRASPYVSIVINHYHALPKLLSSHSIYPHHTTEHDIRLSSFSIFGSYLGSFWMAITCD